MSLSRCTQNPSFMEEWRKGWHPEKTKPKGRSSSILIVGSGPAGLEATMTLGRRGYDVVLAEKKTELGGRVARECRLPGLSAWGRVRDHRIQQISQLPNVQIYPDNEVNATDALEFGSEHIAIATGGIWRNDGVSRYHTRAIPSDSSVPLYTPDDLMNGSMPAGNVLVYDDDHYYMGSVLAELLVHHGASVTLITPSAYVAEWTINTLEQSFVQERLTDLSVDVCLNTALDSVKTGMANTLCLNSKKAKPMQADAIVLVTSMRSSAQLHENLNALQPRWQDHGIKSVTVFGDAEAPAPIAWATYAGHRYATMLDTEQSEEDALPFRRNVINIERAYV